MKRLISIILLVAALPLVGCDSSRAPSFQLSEQSLKLSSFAQDKVQGELNAGFGSPAELVVWPELEIDYGQFGGTIGKVGPRPGTIRIGQTSAEGLESQSSLATDGLLEGLRGAAVVVSKAQPADGTTSEETSATKDTASAPAAYRVASYDAASRLLSVVDESGQPAQLDASEGDTVQILGSTLQTGRNLYLRHCMHCHGVSGDGAGPTAQYFKVKPRDYRQGVIKFTSTKAAVPRPSRDDLFRIIKLGVPGTYMPSFMLLPDDEVNLIVEYVRWLAMRGEMERKLNAWLSTSYSQEAVNEADNPSELQSEFEAEWNSDSSEYIERFGSDLKLDWQDADKPESVVNPTAPRTPSSPESIARGRELFLSKDAKCASCHGETARGNGPSTEAFNDVPGMPPGTKSDKPGLFDNWGNIVKPRDLTTGVFRGGRRPIDIYRRIHSGIKGTPMQAFGTTLKEEQIWDVVNYVLSIPFEDKQSAH
ncbi:MAG: c-type cytochrome [Planctomycetaceae bacterium]|nr:c-type cytochrome [Planctomycetaceae bacterium]